MEFFEVDKAKKRGKEVMEEDERKRRIERITEYMEENCSNATTTL